ncbi:hypothetical protein [Kitasatospora cineracea]|uniref:Uncharacterized protein n=1 Tax=Kitasatospora cineracea TaxID=88074 RepID=A0A3N4R8P0_9ACTN|nr:hypothetical protein [Kitasatospora cineracea]RPE27335.1 hypothetical protein EDD38_7480 [Kitasatospora cineracea]
MFVHECESTLRQRFAAAGVEVTVSTQPPLVDGPYTVDGMTCPHGIAYWWEPTGEQIAQWVRDGVR